MRKLLYLIILSQSINAYSQQRGYNDSYLEIAFGYYFDNIDSTHSVYNIEIYNLSDTMYYNIGYVEKISEVFLRIPSYYNFSKGKLLLIQTGLESERRVFDEIKFNSFYELLKNRLNNDVVVNAYDRFEYIIASTDIQEYTTGNCSTLVLKDKKVIKSKYSGGQYYFPVNYKRHYRHKKTINP